MINPYVDKLFHDFIALGVHKIVKSASVDYSNSSCEVQINEDFILSMMKDVYNIMLVKYSDYTLLIRKLHNYYVKQMFDLDLELIPNHPDPDTFKDEYIQFFMNGKM